MIAALALGGLGVVLAGLLQLARLALAGREQRNANTVADAVDALLPQSQCGQCGYPGCRPYALAVAEGARTDLCTPGGPETVAKLNALLARSDADPNGVSKPVDQVARIDAKACVGCGRCVDACPVDAIAGAPQFLHAVVAAHCTGCGLCLPPCPVDCIDLAAPASAPEARAAAAAFAPLQDDADAGAITARIAAAGIVGMGGGGYPTAQKIREAVAHGADLVIGNGMSSAAGATADHALLREHGREVAAGLALVGRALEAGRADVGDAGPKAVLRVLAVPSNSGLGACAASDVVEVEPAPPAGDERRLVAAVAGRRVPPNGYPTDVGVLVLNVATLFAVYEAVRLGRAPTKRLVTVSGQDAWHALDTPLASLPLPDSSGLRINGVFTGHDAGPDETLSATTFAVDPARPAALACIGCGWCVDVCPEALQPDALHRVFAAGPESGGNTVRGPDAALACVECGACSAVCPSGIDLVAEFRALKTRLRGQDEAGRRAGAARSRWAAREQRLADAWQARRARRAERMRAPRQW